MPFAIDGVRSHFHCVVVLKINLCEEMRYLLNSLRYLLNSQSNKYLN